MLDMVYWSCSRRCTAPNIHDPGEAHDHISPCALVSAMQIAMPYAIPWDIERIAEASAKYIMRRDGGQRGCWMVSLNIFMMRVFIAKNQLQSKCNSKLHDRFGRITELS